MFTLTADYVGIGKVRRFRKCGGKRALDESLRRCGIKKSPRCAGYYTRMDDAGRIEVFRVVEDSREWLAIRKVAVLNWFSSTALQLTRAARAE